MRQNRRFGGINLLAVIAGCVLLAAFCTTGANAQRRLADNSISVVEDPVKPLVAEGSVPERPWTLAGSTGAVDEDSLSLVRFNSFGVNLQTGSTGSVHIRYNITAVEGVATFCAATSSVVRTRFRNSDNSGTTARLTYEIRASNIGAGGNSVLYSFDSNGKGGGSAFKNASDSPAIDFNFATHMYWIEATIFRSDASQFSDLGTIQIWEAAGTPCP